MNTKRIEEVKQAIKQIEGIEQTIKRIKKQVYEYPNEGDIVWVINLFGKVQWEYWTDSLTNMFELGMIFLTKEEAKFERERRRVIKELELFKEPKDRPWNDRNEHYYIAYGGGKVLTTSTYYIGSDDIYFATKEDARAAITFVGEERVKKFYLRIEE